MWTLILADNRDRRKVAEWICKLDLMVDNDGRLERMLYIKYLVDTLSATYGLVEPFTSLPPEHVKPLRTIVQPVVLADLMNDEEDADLRCLRLRADDAKAPPPKRNVGEDYTFHQQQLFPPEGIMCYAAAFSRNDEDTGKDGV